MRKGKSYPHYDEDNQDILTLQEPVAAYACEAAAMPDDMAYAQIVDGVLQVTPDIEAELADADNGDTVTMDEFKMMFARWLEK